MGITPKGLLDIESLVLKASGEGAPNFPAQSIHQQVNTTPYALPAVLFPYKTYLDELKIINVEATFDVSGYGRVK